MANKCAYISLVWVRDHMINQSTETLLLSLTREHGGFDPNFNILSLWVLIGCKLYKELT